MGDLGGADEPPVVGLPERVDRRMRLGPFPSVRDALKFATYVAIGAVPAAVAGPVWWLPFVGGGFVLSVYRAEGRGLDERAADFVAYRLRARGPGSRGPPPTQGGGSAGPVLRVGPGHLVAVLSVRGLPVAFLPPAEARGVFDGYRELLTSLEGGAYFVMGLEPLEVTPFCPPAVLAPPAPAARAGYEEMVRLLCRRRYRRQTLWALWTRADRDGATARLERSVRATLERLAPIGVEARRLRDGELVEAAERIGWPAEFRE